MGNHRDAKLRTILSYSDFCAGREPEPSNPLELFLEVSNLCDLRCAMCTEFSLLSAYRFNTLQSRKRGFLNQEEICGHLDSALAGALVVNCNGYGEATIHPEFRSLISLVSSFEAMATFTTNGMHIDGDMVPFLVDEAVHRVTFSFSGTSKAEYENVYIGGHFEQVLSNIERLAAEKRRRGARYPLIEVNSLGFRHHIEHFDRFVSMMGAAGANVIQLKPLQAVKHLPELHDHVSLPAARELEIVARAKAIGDQLGVYVSAEKYILSATSAGQPSCAPGIPLDALPLLSKPQIRSSTPYSMPELEGDERQAAQALNISALESGSFYCMEPFKSLYIARDGTTKPCCFSAPINLGSVTKKDAMQVWDGAASRAIRNGVRVSSYPDSCIGCLAGQVGPSNHHAGELVETFVEWYTDRHGAKLETALELANAEIFKTLYRSSHHVITGSREDDFPEAMRGDNMSARGNLDHIRNGRAIGWAWIPHGKETRLPIVVRDRRSNRELAQGIACRRRGDLRDAGIGDGYHGFNIPLPPGSPKKINDLKVCYFVSGRERLLQKEQSSFWRAAFGQIGRRLRRPVHAP